MTDSSNTWVTRELTLQRESKSGDRFPATVATETPVRRRFGYEVLDMKRLDLTRAPFPLIESHDTSKLNVGLFEDVHVNGQRLKGMIRLGKSARAQELAEDIREGIVRNVSVGYEAFDPIEDGEIDGIPVYRFAARIHEISLVSAPADTNSGINRSRNPIMENTEHQTRSERRRVHEDSGDEKNRAVAISQAARRFGLQDLGFRAIEEGWSVADFQAKAVVEVERRNAHGVTHHFDPVGGTGRIDRHFSEALQKYSLIKLLRGLADPKALAGAGLELEISQELQRQMGRQAKGIVIPSEILAQRTLTAGSASGGAMTPETYMGSAFIDVLRPKTSVLSLGALVLQSLEGTVVIPRKIASGTGYWINSDHTDSIPPGDPTLDQVSLSPKTAGAATIISHRMLVQGSRDVEEMVRSDLLGLLAQVIDQAAIAGTGASNQPLGITGTTGIDTDTYTNGGLPDFAKIVGMESAIAAANADGDKLAYLTTPSMYGSLKITPRQSSGVEGNFIIQEGKMNDLPASKSSNVPDGAIILGDWSQLVIGMWGGLELDLDPYTHFLKGSIQVRVLADIDVGVRHPEAFSLLTEAEA
ncbi:MAG: hypothetical protein VR73_13090 [Gammaproteobacteria bacterium BRH_c0]|nr:MAG: hypothetical protein VR73_13090 [Gammaproteobacteria bacterium BRH_c0]